MTDRAIHLSVEVPGTPEEVWEAIATGPGISSWYVPAEVAEREGGRVVLDFGEWGEDAGTVTAWEPPRRFAYTSEGESGLAHEWLVEAREGGTCVVRLVNSGFGHGEEWDGQYEGMSDGWRIFLWNLRLHLAHFAGRRGRASTPVVMVPGPNAAAFAALCGALGLAPRLGPGDAVATSGPGVPPLAGRVEEVLRSGAATAYVVVVDAPAPGTAFLAAEGDGEMVACSVWTYLYGDDGAARAGDAWSAFLAERFPAPAPAEGGEAVGA